MIVGRAREMLLLLLLRLLLVIVWVQPAKARRCEDWVERCRRRGLVGARLHVLCGLRGIRPQPLHRAEKTWRQYATVCEGVVLQGKSRMTR